MAEIETREESQALQTAAELIADEYRDDTKGGTVTPEMRWMIRKAWIAGRDWARNQEMLAQIEDHGNLVRAEMERQGRRLMGCTHTPGCVSVRQCVAQESIARKPE